MTPLVSVCVPTYNGARYLAACLDSLLDQSLKDLEILVGDDASTDDTLQVARSREDPRVRVFEFENRAGLARNWNRTLSQARGKYVSLVGQDDHVTQNWAERLVDLLEAHSEADLAFGRREFEVADEHSRRVVGDFFEQRYPAMLESFYRQIETVIPTDVMVAAAMEHRFEINLIGEPSFTMVRREHPATRAGFDVSMRQMLDWEFVTRFFADRPVLHCAEILGTYRIHAAAASIDNAPLSLHYREYDYFLGIVLGRFQVRLDPEQTHVLEQRREEVRILEQEWRQKESGGEK